jgi:hypothetical protein
VNINVIAIRLKTHLHFHNFQHSRIQTSRVLIPQSIQSINQLILDGNIQPFEKTYKDGIRQLWWHKGHPIKLLSTNKGILYDRIFEKTFYIFDNCNGAMEFRKLDTLPSYNLITNRLYFYENRQPSQLFVRVMTPNGATNNFQNINHNKYAQSGAIKSIELFKHSIEFYGFYYYN